MTTRELLENANLAALGLLDNDEHTSYERALGRAPAPVREHILREQARWSSGGELLPAVEAPDHLRDRVMDAVRGAIVDDEIAQSAGAFEAGAFQGQRRVSPLWRGGALGLLCACVGLTGVVFYLQRTEHNNMATNASMARLEGLNQSIGYQFVDDIAFDASTRHVAFVPQGGFAGRLTLYANDKWEEWQTLSSDMPALLDDERYSLVELTAEGKVAAELANFTGHIQLANHSLRPVEKGTRIALVISKATLAPTAERILMVATIS